MSRNSWVVHINLCSKYNRARVNFFTLPAFIRATIHVLLKSACTLSWAAPVYVLAETLREYHEAKASFEDVSAAPSSPCSSSDASLTAYQLSQKTLAYSPCDLYFCFFHRQTKRRVMSAFKLSTQPRRAASDEYSVRKNNPAFLFFFHRTTKSCCPSIPNA